ncbi:arsenate reductase/protein-tyrosine-phosphatase family protein [Rhodococcus chondri]|uniref:Protein tyrosine phosphatase n=1 Tax=Rhodococcus chondri TaxID=3065941 RepID=A0ABU7JZ76_9NOCA|nr:protein tyrosine phosphatase [Rhodococcus sp. CC-R104]MEE2034874.1 protein tyrosine phosphatase [Rhodococcus sp. CC-R104]
MRVLYVCTRNTCLSPTAERLTTAYAEECGRPALTAHSAGTGAMVGHGMEPTAALVLQQLGGTSEGFVARPLDTAIAQDSDMIITMSEQQRRSVIEAAPDMTRSVFTLREAARLQQISGAATVAELTAARTQLSASEPEDIVDPTGSDEETFITVGSEIADLLIPLLARIQE